MNSKPKIIANISILLMVIINLDESQAIKKWTRESPSASPQLYFHKEFEKHSTKGNPIVTKKISEDNDLIEKNCVIYTPPVPDDDYVESQGCYVNMATPYSNDIANVLCSGKIDIDNLMASEECSMIGILGKDCWFGEFSEDVIKRHHCQEDLDLIKDRATQIYHGCVG
ncbi:RING/FYVE/PHD zinc finger superfamily protein [Striga asiatica]|uniref:RING/FYVE/PHD zinc finger superfamily protein n=1 Tax=Striga asiatica TaxID=4170 RepID=A0A5A7QBM8_STRAF|nr:RING/FYVE/PHD zinc finger superfamily protein [Striga asiatica]